MTKPLPEFAQTLPNLASQKLGAEVIQTTDDFFADKARMINDAPPVWIADKYDDHGKWMDGWESRRRRNSGHDHAIIKLAGPGKVTGFNIDTSYFTGNYPPAASVEGCYCTGDPDERTHWTPLLSPMKLGPSSPHYFTAEDAPPVTHLRLNIFPDGGIARFQAFGRFHHDWSKDLSKSDMELSSLKRGGQVIAYNDAHYGNPYAIISEGRGKTMADGWETRRRREPGFDWIILALGHAGVVERIELDTAHFKGNFPDRFSVNAAQIAPNMPTDALITNSIFWQPLIDEQKLSADSVHHYYSHALADLGAITHVRLNIFPDGGVSRLRLFGRAEKISQ